MTTRGVILDLDGTLVDTNGRHVEAWRRAFARFGYDVPAARIGPQIGKGGDQLVPALIGAEAADRDGEQLREEHGRQFVAIAAAEAIPVFPGAVELIEALKRRGVQTALATSSNDKHLTATFRSCGVDFADLVDERTTADDADASKPAPDLVHAALAKLGLAAGECAMLGDTPYDGEAAGKAGVRFWAVRCGGFPEEVLKAAGAAVVLQDPAEVYASLDRLLG
ncbi:MAG: HAD family hydrolase [Gemmataceae bacterium]